MGTSSQGIHQPYRGAKTSASSLLVPQLPRRYRYRYGTVWHSGARVNQQWLSCAARQCRTVYSFSDCFPLAYRYAHRRGLAYCKNSNRSWVCWDVRFPFLSHAKGNTANSVFGWDKTEGIYSSTQHLIGTGRVLQRPMITHPSSLRIFMAVS